MLTYKDQNISFPSQIKKHNIFLEKFYKKNKIYEDSEYDNDFFINENQEYLVSSIIEAFTINNNIQLAHNISYLTTYLVRKMPSFFPLLIESKILEILVQLASPYDKRDCITNAFICIFNITALFSDTTSILIENNFLHIVYYRILNLNISKSSFYNFSTLGNILCDAPQLIPQAVIECPASIIISKIMSPKSNIDKKNLFSILKLFKLYLSIKLPPQEKSKIFNFFIFCLESKNQEMVIGGMNGLNIFLIENQADEEDYKKLSEIDILEILLYFDNLKDMVTGIEVFIHQVKYSLKGLNYDFRQLFELCIEHFDDAVGISSYEALATILLNCEEDTAYSFILCDKPKFLNVATHGIKNGCYYIVIPAGMALLSIIRACKDFNTKFITEDVFDSLLKLFSIENENYIRKDVIEVIHLIFERAIAEGLIDECITIFDYLDGCQIYYDFISNQENPQNSSTQISIDKCVHFLNRFFPLE